MGVKKEERSARARRRIVEASRATELEDARREWEYTGNRMDEGDEKFPGVCELCGEPRVQEVFHIFNPYTGREFWVGRQCVRHFVLRGAQTPEESQRMFEQRIRREDLMKGVLQPAATAVLSGKADWDLLVDLQRATLRYFECRSMQDVRQLIEADPDRWRRFIAEIAGVPDYEDLGEPDRRLLRDALLEPRKIAKPTRRRFRNPTEKEMRELAMRRSRAGGTQVVLGGIGRGQHTRPAGRGLE